MSERRQTRRAGPDPIANDRRRARKLHRLPADAACTFCGERNPDALVAVKRSVLDGHHAVGEAHDPRLIVVLCKSHHAIVTALGWDAALDLSHEPRSVLARTAGALESLAVFLQALVEAILRFAAELVALESALDRRYPTWRRLAEADRDA
jgi:hypothetical protein